jgi:hypothetical protein
VPVPTGWTCDVVSNEIILEGPVDPAHTHAAAHMKTELAQVTLRIAPDGRLSEKCRLRRQGIGRHFDGATGTWVDKKVSKGTSSKTNWVMMCLVQNGRGL